MSYLHVRFLGWRVTFHEENHFWILVLWPSLKNKRIHLHKSQSSKIPTAFKAFFKRITSNKKIFNLKSISSLATFAGKVNKNKNFKTLFSVQLEGWDREGERETQEGGDMGIYVYV